MFDTFKMAFFSDAEDGRVVMAPPNISIADKQVCELLIRYGGRSFNKGIYRIIPMSDVKYWNGLVLSAFTNFSDRITCFGVDWLGRIFAVDSARLEDGLPGVLMLEPGSAQALEIPCNVETFHEHELISYREEALAESFYQQWLGSGGIPPTINQCIGYKKPLFLGGSDTLDNLELSDLDVYWTVTSQLINKARGLSSGQSLGKVTID